MPTLSGHRLKSRCPSRPRNRSPKGAQVGLGSGWSSKALHPLSSTYCGTRSDFSHWLKDRESAEDSSKTPPPPSLAHYEGVRSRATLSKLEVSKSRAAIDHDRGKDSTTGSSRNNASCIVADFVDGDSNAYHCDLIRFRWPPCCSKRASQTDQRIFESREGKATFNSPGSTLAFLTNRTGTILLSCLVWGCTHKHTLARPRPPAARSCRSVLDAEIPNALDEWIEERGSRLRQRISTRYDPSLLGSILCLPLVGPSRTMFGEPVGEPLRQLSLHVLCPRLLLRIIAYDQQSTLTLTALLISTPWMLLSTGQSR